MRSRRVPQDDAQSCYAHMLDKQMAVIDWSKSAHEIDCLIRGLNPWPIALTTLSGERLKVFAAEKAAGNGEPGTVLEADPKKGLTVACGEGALRTDRDSAGRRQTHEGYGLSAWARNRSRH